MFGPPISNAPLLPCNTFSDKLLKSINRERNPFCCAQRRQNRLSCPSSVFLTTNDQNVFFSSFLFVYSRRCCILQSITKHVPNNFLMKINKTKTNPAWQLTQCNNNNKIPVGAIFKKGIRVVQAVSHHPSHHNHGNQLANAAVDAARNPGPGSAIIAAASGSAAGGGSNRPNNNNNSSPYRSTNIHSSRNYVDLISLLTTSSHPLSLPQNCLPLNICLYLSL